MRYVSRFCDSNVTGDDERLMTVKTNFVACLQFLEASNIVEILREAGPSGLHVKEIAHKASELRRQKNDAEPESIEFDPSKISAYSSPPA